MSVNVNNKNRRVGGNGDPLLLSGNLNVIDFFVEFPNSDRIFKIRMFPELDLSVFSSSDKILSIFVDIQSIDRAVVGLKACLADTELVPDLGISIPRDSHIVGLVRNLGNLHFADDISVLVLSGGGLDLALGVPNSGQLIKS